MATRLEQLAVHKASLLRSPDRRSVYWLDELAPVRTSTTTFRLTARGAQLCRGKPLWSTPHPLRSPVWRVSEGALRACASQRVCALALPRPPAVGWLPDRPPPPPLSQPRLRPRVEATDGGPRLRPRVEATDGGPRLRPRVEAGQGFRTPPIARKTPAATPRVEQLATPKRTPPGYLCGRPSSWPVPGSVRRAVPSLRVRELASPRQREALFQGYDPYAISAGALLAKPSPRLQELALPLPRKCRSE
ncbi:sperm microtubule associated protein 2 [Gadus chalcogrammus]|uniref:sperm microtubule associated protein 2 n=1 Tax=Gadus chalcogrammus TaxID=1042646 RepID=UPI0024C36B1C|nr:sperm microtubule associated protein 2 [Gadus chalcogrammus]